jgi:hypothetical protein
MKALKSLDIFNNWWYGTPIKKVNKKKGVKKDETNKTSKFDLRGLGSKRRSKK